MPTRDNIYIGDEARAKLMEGINIVARAVGSTMGTGGSNAVIEAIESPGHLMTNDGYTIANSIVLADPIQDMGRKILVEAINRANKASGDGSSTTCVLTASIMREGMKHVTDTHPMTIKRSLEECIPLIEASIKAQTRQLEVAGELSLAMLEEVATISSEDTEIGRRIAEIYGKIGKTGLIHWDISKTAEDSYTIGSGITVEGAGWYSPYMCDATENGQSTNQIRIKNPYILITKQKLTSAADVGDIAAALNGKEVKDLVIFADDVEPLVVPDLIKTRMVRGFRIVVVKMPVIFKDHWFADLALATGAKVVDPAAGLPMKATTVAHLGTCDNILITKDDTFLDGVKDMTDHIAELNKMGEDDSTLRASRLNTKTARYFVGAQSDSALSYRRLKVEDAIAAAYQALNGGIVAGGGVALVNASMVFPETIGGLILAQALKAPMEQIIKNSGMEDMEVSTTQAALVNPTTGFDTKTGKVVDMFEAGIIDPANIVLNAVKNAISVAAAILTVESVVTFPRIEQPQGAQPPVSR